MTASGLDVCLPPKLLGQSLKSQCDGWSLWGIISHEGGALINLIRALIRRDRRKMMTLCSPLCEDTAKRTQSVNQEEASPETLDRLAP